MDTYKVFHADADDSYTVHTTETKEDALIEAQHLAPSDGDLIAVRVIEPYICPCCEEVRDNAQSDEAKCSDCGRCLDCAPSSELGTHLACDACRGE